VSPVKGANPETGTLFKSSSLTETSVVATVEALTFLLNVTRIL
jgi:hypothetical protein